MEPSADIPEVARNPRFISGIHNYCDRWCERCPLASRCLSYATENGEPDAAIARKERDASSEEFWEKNHAFFQKTIQRIRDEARARGVDLDDPAFLAEVEVQEQSERRHAAKNRPLTDATKVYSAAVDNWFVSAMPVFAEIGGQLEILDDLGLSDAPLRVDEMNEQVRIIRWYQHFIFVKLSRAIASCANEELVHDQEDEDYPKDSDGSAKIALIAIDRSIEAWVFLREILGENDVTDEILHVLVKLAAIRRKAEEIFPAARFFVRPGFDDLV